MKNTSSEIDFTFDEGEPNFSISNFQGRLGCTLLGRMELDIKKRFSNAKKIDHFIKEGHEDLFSPIRVDSKENLNKIHYIRYPMLVKKGFRDLVLAAFIENGVEASAMYVEDGMRVDAKLFPGAFRIASDLLTIPCHPYVDDEDMDAMLKVIRNTSGWLNDARS